MIVWIDAQISPGVAAWINHVFPNIQAIPVRSLKLLETSDKEIFFSAKTAKAIIMTKDQDFYQLLAQYGPPPQIIWITCGNTSTQNLCKLLETALPLALDLLNKGEKIVEIH